MNLNPVILAIPMYFTLMAIELVYEAITRKHTYRLNDAVTNISTGTLQQFTNTFLHILNIGIYTLIFEQFAFFHIELNAWSFLVLFILYDFCYYWEHRVAHEVSLFWGGHIVHHQSEDFNLSVALRQSSTSIIWGFVFFLPLALIGFNPIQLALVGGFNLLYQFWIHTEHINKMGWLEVVMNTPSHHRVHHGRNPKYIDKNYAGVFIIWDRMFGTFQAEEERPTYGITVALNSWNPVYANFSHYTYLFEMARQAKSTKDVFKILFKGPGYLPDYLEPFVEARKRKLQDPKYDMQHHFSGINRYVLVQFVVALGIIAYFFFTQSQFELSTKLLYGAWIVGTTLLFGFLFEYRGKWLIVLEWVRLAAIPIGINALQQAGAELPNFISIALLVFAVLSMIIFFFVFNKSTNLTQPLTHV